ncbi:hypothetical protein GH714_029270 [Hevea brasiliensis]|uniref:Uncharacterized protein n=1 Tax=Hevea brasiliensis TaxID=3981 RepID=A0A6A6N3C6_HEVBR|nr:hypothetical protein GH714_029270 [Hevea brasiliensis]
MPNGSLDSHLFKEKSLLTWVVRDSLKHFTFFFLIVYQVFVCWRRLKLRREIELANGGTVQAPQYDVEKLVGTTTNANEKISEARLRRFLIRGLKKEYTPFVTSIQGWAKQPSVEELESLLSNQEALAKQMAKNFESKAILFSKGKHDKKNMSAGNKNNKEGPNVGNAATDNLQNPNIVKWDRSGKIRHIKKICRVKLSKENVARDKEDGDQLKWEQCFTMEVAEGRDNVIVEST